MELEVTYIHGLKTFYPIEHKGSKSMEFIQNQFSLQVEYHRPRVVF